jgi:transposase-like protein
MQNDNNQTNGSHKSGRRYDAEFKQNAVDLVLQEGRQQTEVARNLGISGWALSCWIKQAKGGSLREPKTLTQESDSERENRRLRQEVDYLRRQRDILKKALSILSGDNLLRATF